MKISTDSIRDKQVRFMYPDIVIIIPKTVCLRFDIHDTINKATVNISQKL